MNSLSRWTIISLTLLVALVYSFWQRDPLKKEAIIVNKSNLSATLKNTKNVDESVGLVSEGPTLIHFWGTWCPPCLEELPALLGLLDKMRSNGIRVLLIAVNDDVKKVNKFFKKNKLKLDQSVYVDSGQKLMNELGVFKVPESILVDKDGNAILHLRGAQQWNDSLVEKLIK